MKIRIYGIKNCDTMKKSFNWLDERGIAYTFIDYRVEGVSLSKVEEWLTKVPPAELINVRSTTFKELPEKEKLRINQPDTAAGLAISNLTMLKRPLIEAGNNIFLGYKPKEWEEALL